MRFLIALFIFLCCSCTNKADRFILDETAQEKYTVHFQKQIIKPLKKEWRELYDYAKNGHVLKSAGSKDFFTSVEFLRYIDGGVEHKILEIPFFNEYKNVLAFFGEPTYIHERKGLTNIIYRPVPLDDTCETCSINNGFGFVFDSKTMTLFRE